MVQVVEKRIFLRDADGGVVPFDAGELQTRLIGGFLAAGLREESFMSEEIVLALEYIFAKRLYNFGYIISEDDVARLLCEMWIPLRLYASNVWTNICKLV